MSKVHTKELKDFMNLHGVSQKELSDILGVTIPAISMWLSGKRELNVMTIRLIRMFNKYPRLIKDFTSL